MVKVKNVGLEEMQIQTTMSYYLIPVINKISSVQSLSHIWLFATPWTAARQASLSITNSWSLPKLMPIKSVMPSNHLILCRPLLLLPSILPSIMVFSNESALSIWWPQYWSFSLNISPKAITKKDKRVGQDAEKNGHLHTAGGNINWCSHYGKQLDVSSEN